MAKHPRQTEWERELNRNYYACGCDTGATGVLLGMLVGGIAGAASLVTERFDLLSAFGLALGTAVVGGLAGKITGKLRARARLLRTIDEIVSVMPAPEATSQVEPSCG